MDLKDRVVLLTGGADPKPGAPPNMGGAIARAMAKAGAIVVLSDLDGARAKLTAESIVASGGRVTGMQLDVGDRAACVAAVEKVVTDHGRIDVLHNHAGAAQLPLIGAAATDDETWDFSFALNVTAAFILSRTALRHMLKRGSGVIINTISEAGLRGGASGAAYTAAKHGLVGLTKNIAWHYAKTGIRCNGLCPGGVHWPLDPATVKMAGPDDDPNDAPRVEPIINISPRFLKPEEIGHFAVFLASDASSGLNGQIIAADGGWAAG